MDGKDKPAERPGESEPQAKKGAPPPDKTAPYITVDEAETSKDSYVSKRAMLVDDNVQGVTSSLPLNLGE
jgi:hypothetical protein